MGRLPTTGAGHTGAVFSYATLPHPGSTGMAGFHQYVNTFNPLNAVNAGHIWTQLTPAISSVKAFALLALAVTMLIALLRAVTQAMHRTRKSEADELTYLELVFPADTSKSSFATEQLYSLLHSPAIRQGWSRPRTKRYSLEIAASKSDGVRYVLVLPEDEALAIEMSLRSYLPGLIIRRVPDYAQTVTISARAVCLTLAADYALPLRDQGKLTDHDPAAYITGQMAHLEPGEMVAYQLVLTPHRGYRTPRSGFGFSNCANGLPVACQ